jgi:hypothetical protein
MALALGSVRSVLHAPALESPLGLESLHHIIASIERIVDQGGRPSKGGHIKFTQRNPN